MSTTPAQAASQLTNSTSSASAMDFSVGYHPQLYLTIAGGQDIGPLMQKFEWKSFVNGGYIIRGKVSDTAWIMLRDIATDFYLAKGLKEPTEVVFQCTWPGANTNNADTGKHYAYMTECEAKGLPHSGFVEFVAVDPPSYLLNQGGSSGKVYQGAVSDVITQVVSDYAPDVSVTVSPTTDYNQNYWYMNRMDPKTFLGSLLDWSSSITKQRTNWIVSSDDFEIFIKEQADKQSVNYGTLSFNMKTPGGNDIYNFELLTDSFISVFERQVITQGMSAVSEKYWDRVVDSQGTVLHVNDATTPNKRKTDLGQAPTRGFSKPTGAPDAPESPHDWSTSVLAVPEIYSNEDIGLRYDAYIDGRARKSFLDMLNLNMRVKFRTTGIGLPALASSHNLGVSKIKVIWRDANNNPYFLDGDWLVYGFHHIMTVGHWYTDLYCYRLPWDATGQNV